MKNSTLFGLLLMAILFIQCEGSTPDDDLCCPACPVVESISPTTAIAGDIITITGKNFGRFGESDDDRVEIGGIVANITGEISNTKIMIEVPEEVESGEVVVYSANAAHASNRNTLASNVECLLEQYPVLTLDIIETPPFQKCMTDIASSELIISCKIDDEKYVFAFYDHGFKYGFFNEKGEIIGSIREYKDVNIDILRPRKIVKNDNYGFWITGEYRIHPDEDYGSFVMGFDETGEKLTAPKIYSKMSPINLIGISDDNYIIAGNYRQNLFVSLINSMGQIHPDWTTDDFEGIIFSYNELVPELQYEPQRNLDEILLKQLTNNTIVISVQVRRNSAYDHSWTLILDTTDGTLKTSDINEYFQNSLLPLEDDSFLALSSNPYTDEIYLIEQIFHSTLSYKEIFHFGGVKTDIGTDIIMNSNGEYIFIGETNSFRSENNKSNALIVGFSPDTHEYWYNDFNAYSDIGHVRNPKVYATKDGGYLIVGSITGSGYDYHPYFAKTDCKGQIH